MKHKKSLILFCWFAIGMDLNVLGPIIALAVGYASGQHQSLAIWWSFLGTWGALAIMLNIHLFYTLKAEMQSMFKYRDSFYHFLPLLMVLTLGVLSLVLATKCYKKDQHNQKRI